MKRYKCKQISDSQTKFKLKFPILTYFSFSFENQGWSLLIKLHLTQKVKFQA